MGEEIGCWYNFLTACIIAPEPNYVFGPKFENNFEEIISNWAHDDYLIQKAWYTTEKKFSFEFKFCWLANGKLAKFKICLLSYF